MKLIKTENGFFIDENGNFQGFDPSEPGELVYWLDDELIGYFKWDDEHMDKTELLYYI